MDVDAAAGAVVVGAGFVAAAGAVAVGVGFVVVAEVGLVLVFSGFAPSLAQPAIANTPSNTANLVKRILLIFILSLRLFIIS